MRIGLLGLDHQVIGVFLKDHDMRLVDRENDTFLRAELELVPRARRYIDGLDCRAAADQTEEYERLFVLVLTHGRAGVHRAADNRFPRALIQNLVERTTGVRASESWLEDLMRQGSGLPSGYGQGQVRRPLQRECRVIRQSHGRFVHARAGTRYTPARETC
ncbi:MAG: hypothetical protein IPK17_26060 [Chloroflexi bacterium]|uniref:hypothetical protein n=1 Tax=Candidatus Flexifilum breve TaxID=3140694 RepID=UPI003134700F|nr:hypothetical protein [Chloroflexota bacterium]